MSRCSKKNQADWAAVASAAVSGGISRPAGAMSVAKSDTLQQWKRQRKEIRFIDLFKSQIGLLLSRMNHLFADAEYLVRIGITHFQTVAASR